MQDLYYLEQQSNPGPFSSTEQVKMFMEQMPEAKEKSQQIYIEVRFQKNTNKFIKNDNVIFCLKRAEMSLIFVCILTNHAVSLAYQWVI